MDPRKAECHGLFLYGSGFFYERDQRVSQLTNRAKAFCNTDCPRTQTCWSALRATVQAEQPHLVEEYEREMVVAAEKGIGSALFSAMRARDGRPDPYMQRSLVNFRKGRAASVAQDDA